MLRWKPLKDQSDYLTQTMIFDEIKDGTQQRSHPELSGGS